ncbi:MAG: hypothetical protein ACRCR3_12050 [Tannerellaceae bacterium]
MKIKIFIAALCLAGVLSLNAQGRRKGGEPRLKKFDMNQTVSKGAQVNTIAFSALAFYTGTPYSASFYPPGKVADFFGFQYMRDNDLSESGHNTDFLTKAAWHTMHLLEATQMQKLIDLAVEQEQLFKDYALGRLVLIDAFYRNLNGDIPEGANGLDIEQIKKVSRELYLIDAEISYGRALVFAEVINSLTPEQVDALQKMGKEGMQKWSMPEKPKLRIPRGLNVWVMSNASEMFSWYLRGVEADVYFCPERQGTYFGGFYMKDAPAVGNAGYAIDSEATSGKGSSILNDILTYVQAQQIRAIYDQIKTPLDNIVQVRESISIELRNALVGIKPDKKKIVSLCALYGEFDGEYIYAMADTFAKVGKTLSSEQKQQMMRLRDLAAYPEKAGKVFIYSAETDMPEIPSSDFLFK